MLNSYWMVLWRSFWHLVLQHFHLRLAYLHIICQKSGHTPLHKICILSFCCISRSKGKTQSWCWLALERHGWSWPSYNHFLVLRLWCMIQTNWRPVSTSRMPNAPNSQLQIILELIWNKRQFESDEAFQNLTYWKVLRICKLNVLIQNLTTCVSLKQNSHKFQVSTLCHTLIHWQEAQEWCFA